MVYLLEVEVLYEFNKYRYKGTSKIMNIHDDIFDAGKIPLILYHYKFVVNKYDLSLNRHGVNNLSRLNYDKLLISDVLIFYHLTPYIQNRDIFKNIMNLFISNNKYVIIPLGEDFQVSHDVINKTDYIDFINFVKDNYETMIISDSKALVRDIKINNILG